MDAGSQLLQAAVPFFLVLLLLELWLDKHLGTRRYRRAQTWADLATGSVSQVCDLLLKAACLPLYVWLYERARLFDLARSPIAHWAVALLGVDFLYYFWHRAGHESRVMWAVHSVHHQSEDMNLAVALRQPALQGPSVVLFFLPLALLGVTPRVVMLAYTCNLIYQFWIHTEFVRSLGPLEWLLNTPSHHRVHHGKDAQYLDKNYGGVLIVWDRLFGTFEPEREPPRYGITKQLDSFNPVWANLVEFAWLIEQTRRVRGLRARLRLWFGHPASALPGLPAEAAPAPLSKRDAAPPSAAESYVVMQAFLLFVPLNSAFLFLAHRSPPSFAATAWAAIAVLWSAVALLGWVERRPFIARSEPARALFLVLGAGVVSAAEGPQVAVLVTLTAALLFGAPLVWLLWRNGRAVWAFSRT